MNIKKKTDRLQLQGYYFWFPTCLCKMSSDRMEVKIRGNMKVVKIWDNRSEMKGFVGN